MRAAVPAAWRDLPATFTNMLWFGVTRFADDLALALGSGRLSPTRHGQLATIRDLQGALGRFISLKRAERAQFLKIGNASVKAERAFLRATSAVRGELSAIRREIAAAKKLAR